MSATDDGSVDKALASPVKGPQSPCIKPSEVVYTGSSSGVQMGGETG